MIFYFFFAMMHTISTLTKMVDFIFFSKKSFLLVECLQGASKFSLKSTSGNEAFLEYHQPRAHFPFSKNPLGHRNFMLDISVFLSFPTYG